MGKDTVTGAIKETGGKVRASIARVTGDTEGEIRGKADQAAGNVQKNYGKAKDAVKDALDA